MATEIERKFLVDNDGWRGRAEGSKAIRQAYLALDGRATVRVRIVDGLRAFLTVKSAVAGTTRSEFEYFIPVDDAEALMELRTGLVIEKRRHIVPIGNCIWEIDVFEGAHRGLTIAEIELPSADTAFERPDWIGREVTDDLGYYNASLAAAVPAA